MRLTNKRNLGPLVPSLTRREVLCGAIAAGASAGIAACSAGSTEEEGSSNGAADVEKAQKTDISDVHLRDKDDLYTVYDDSGIVTMWLTVSRGNDAENTNHSWSEINTYSVYDYAAMGVKRYQVCALLQVVDDNGPSASEVGFGAQAPNATVQVRGQTSSRNAQKNYKIELKKGKGAWRSQRSIALNKHMGEGMRFRNKLAYDLIRGIDQMMGLRTQFVHLYVKDETGGAGDAAFEDYGVYTQVEQLNKSALKAHGLDENGHLYKVNSFDFQRYPDVIKLADDPTYNLSDFEGLLEVKGSSDHQKLIDMLDELNDENHDMEDILAKHFDVENLTYWLAFQMLTGNCDTQNRNCYLYSPLNSDVWYFLDWDNDGMLRKYEMQLTKFTDYQSWERGVSNYWGNVLFRRALLCESFRSALDDAVEDLRSTLSDGRLPQMIEHYRSVIEERLYETPDSLYMPVTRDQYGDIAAAIPDEVGENYRSYKESLEKPLPFYIGLPVASGTQLKLNWSASYDFQGRDIRYSVELSSDYAFGSLLFSQQDVVIPEVTCDLPSAGQYFVRVRATTTDGVEQDAFDYYVTDEGKHYGMKCFYVGADGSIAEDTYEE